MDLRQLEYFLLIARRGSITAAASDLGIAQPTLTKSIRLLEQELSVKLFERHPRGVVLTDSAGPCFGTRRASTFRFKMRSERSKDDAAGLSASSTSGRGPRGCAATSPVRSRGRWRSIPAFR